MLSEFISITNLQKQLKKVFASKQPIYLVMSKNTINGMVFSKKATEMIIDSGVLDQIREELWELNDKETRDIVLQQKKGKGENVPYEKFMKEEYGI